MSACGPPAPQCSDVVAGACRPRGASVALAGRGVAEAFDASEGNVALRAHAQPAATPDANPTTLADAQPDVQPNATPNAVPSTVPDDPADAVPDAVPDGQSCTTPSATLQLGARLAPPALQRQPGRGARVRARPVSPPHRRPTLRGAHVAVPSGGRVVRVRGYGDFNAGPEYEEATRILESLYGMTAEEEAAWLAEEAAWLAERNGDGGVS